ncbi:hypothetical protein [Sphingomonas sp. Leaf205]|uniref:hypothetical protein n=1 Tax=Sphingomonas sp. Leaf205 TaxID=2876551 RepID=UPI001E5A2ACD|nr:hypothetical protein [Sphingomonas sp. Leaf205]
MTKSYAVEIPDDATPLEREYFDALGRIVAGRARDLALRERGAIRPSQPNVAKEAGRSRTAISGEACALPRVKLEIMRAQEWHRDSKRPEAALREIAELGRERALRRETADALQKGERYKRQRDAAFTSSAACGMLAVALQRLGRAADVDLTRARRDAEQRAISNRPTSAL